MSTAAADPIREDVERALRRIVDVTVVTPWMVATWAPRCLLARLGRLRASAPAAVRTVADLTSTSSTMRSPQRLEAPAYRTGSSPQTDATRAAVARPASTTDSAGDPRPTLPIEDYESLAASQVVTRLGALSPEALEQVRDFERAHRGRRTILGKIDQLLG